MFLNKGQAYIGNGIEISYYDFRNNGMLTSKISAAVSADYMVCRDSSYSFVRDGAAGYYAVMHAASSEQAMPGSSFAKTALPVTNILAPAS